MMRYSRQQTMEERYEQEIARLTSMARQYEGYAEKVTGNDRRAEELRESYRVSARTMHEAADRERANLAALRGQLMQTSLFGEAA